eukprot:gene31243-41632_t
MMGRKLGSLATGGVAGGIGWWLTTSALLAGVAGLLAVVLVGVFGMGSARRGGGGIPPIIWGGGGGGWGGGGGGGGGFSSGGGGDFGGAVLGRSQATGTILNDDAAPDTTPDQFGFASVTDVALGSVQTSNPITVAGINAASPISVVGGSYSVNGGAFVTTSGTVTVGQTVRVQQTASNTAGATTVATLTIGGVSANYSVTTALPSVSIADASISEGNSGTTNLSFTVSLSSAASSVVTVPYTTADGTATTADNDYVAGSGTVSFPAGSTSQTLNVSINGDTKFESDETFVVNLGAPSGAALGRGQAIGTIVNDDTSTPTLSIADASTQEGNAGTKNLPFTVTLSPPSSNGTATSGSDYNGGTLTITFAPGETTKTGNVGIRGDTDSEPDETFFVTLNTPTGGAVLGRSQATGTILNDDAAPDTTPDQFGFASVTDVALGSVQTSNPITVAGINAASPISVVGGSYSVNGGAFVTTSGTVTVGQTVRVQQTASNTAGATTVATLTIGGVSANYSVTTALPSVSIADASISEGNSGTTNLSFTVSLSSAASSVVTVPYTTADGTATTADNDYVAGSGTVSFPAGSTSQTLNVSINGDTKFESDETFVVNLGAPSGAALGRGQAIGTIVNDDSALPSVSIDDVSIIEGNSGTTTARLTFTLSVASTQAVTVRFATANGTATAGVDYTTRSGTTTFNPGETSRTQSFTVIGDTDPESDETFFGIRIGVRS